MPAKYLTFCFAKFILLSLLATTGDTVKEWGPTTEGCRINLAVDHDISQIGEPINLHVALQNTGRHELPVNDQGISIDAIEVILPGGADAPLTLWGRRQVDSLRRAIFRNVMLRLGNGETKSDDFPSLNRAFDMTLEGQYTIVVHRRLPSETDPKAWVDVWSNQVVIQIKSSN